MRSLRLVIVSTAISELLLLSFISYFHQYSLNTPSTSSWKYGGNRFDISSFTTYPSKAHVDKILTDASNPKIDEMAWPIHTSVSWAAGNHCFPHNDTTLSSISRQLTEALSSMHALDTNTTQRYDFIGHAIKDHNETQDPSSTFCDDVSISDLMMKTIQTDYSTLEAANQGGIFYIFFSCGCSSTIPNGSFAAVDVDSHGNILARLPSWDPKMLYPPVMDPFPLIQGPLTRLIYNQLLSLSSRHHQDGLTDTSKIIFHMTLAGHIYQPDATHHLNSTPTRELYYHNLASLQDNLGRTLSPIIHDMLGQVFDTHASLHTLYDPRPLSSSPFHQKYSSNASKVVPSDQTRILFDGIMNRFSRKEILSKNTQSWNFIIYVPETDTSPLFFTNDHGQRSSFAVNFRDRVAIYINDTFMYGRCSDEILQCDHSSDSSSSYFRSLIRRIANLPSDYANGYHLHGLNAYGVERHVQVKYLQDHNGISQWEINILKRSINKLRRRIEFFNTTTPMIITHNHESRYLSYQNVLSYLKECLGILENISSPLSLVTANDLVSSPHFPWSHYFAVFGSFFLPLILALTISFSKEALRTRIGNKNIRHIIQLSLCRR